jgi:hypothetical protein
MVLIQPVPKDLADSAHRDQRFDGLVRLTRIFPQFPANDLQMHILGGIASNSRNYSIVMGAVSVSVVIHGPRSPREARPYFFFHAPFPGAAGWASGPK